MSEDIDRWNEIFDKRNEILMSTIGSVENADVNIVEELLLHKLLEVTPLPSGVTGLHAACLLNNFELVKLFIENGRDVNAETVNRDTPLHLLLIGPEVDVDIVHYLINHGSDLTLRDTIYDTPLYVAVRKKHVSAVRAILQYTHNINEIYKKEFEITPLMYAAHKGYLEIVDMLLTNGADPNIILKERLAIHYSIKFDNADVFKYLLEKTNYESINKCETFYPLSQRIIDSLSINCMKVLLQSAYRKELLLNKTYFNPLYFKKVCGVTYLLNKIAFCEFSESQNGRCEEMFNVMIENGFSLNPVSRELFSPLTAACSPGVPISYVEKLIQHGADVNYLYSNFPEALLYALHGSTPDVLHLLFRFSNFATPDSIVNVSKQEDFVSICSENISFCLALGMTPSAVSLLRRYNKTSDVPTVNICSLKQLSRIAVRHMFHSKWNNLSINEILKKLHLPDSVCQYLKYEIV